MDRTGSNTSKSTNTQFHRNRTWRSILGEVNNLKTVLCENRHALSCYVLWMFAIMRFMYFHPPPVMLLPVVFKRINYGGALGQ